MATEQKRSLKTFYWAWGILTVVGVVLSLWLPHRYMPTMMSNDGHLAFTTTILFSVLAAPVAAGVYAAAYYVLRAYRYRGDGRAAASLSGSRRHQVAGDVVDRVGSAHRIRARVGPRCARGGKLVVRGESVGRRRDRSAVGVDVRLPGHHVVSDVL